MSRDMGADGARQGTDWEAVARYLAGESPAAEREAIQAWLASQPAESRTIAALDDVLDRLALTTNDASGVDVEAALTTVKARRNEADRKPMGRTLDFRRRSAVWIPMVAA